jgi:hypothetical protein
VLTSSTGGGGGDGASRKSRTRMLNLGDHRQWVSESRCHTMQPVNTDCAVDIGPLWIHSAAAAVLLGSLSWAVWGVSLARSLVQTALHVAAARGSVGVVKLLLAAGCSAALRNNDGLTALELAEQLMKTDVAEVLREKQNIPCGDTK